MSSDHMFDEDFVLSNDNKNLNDKDSNNKNLDLTFDSLFEVFCCFLTRNENLDRFDFLF